MLIRALYNRRASGPSSITYGPPPDIRAFVMAGRKSSSQFFATFPQANNLTRDDICGILAPISADHVVALEKHADGGIHFHAAILTTEPYFLTQLRDYFFIYLDPEAALDLQTIKRAKDCVHYVCKEDLEAVVVGDFFKPHLPFSIKAMEFIRSDPVYTRLHPFVLAHWNAYNFLEITHAEYWAKHAVPATIGTLDGAIQESAHWYTVGGKDFLKLGWVSEVMAWGQSAFVPEREHKQKQLYLYGPPDSGKTTLLNSLFDTEKCYYAGRDKWWFDQFVPTQHTWVMLDEFYYESFSCKAELLKLLAGEPFVANVKGRPPVRIKINVPVVLCTNDLPPEVPALAVRCTFVCTDEGKCYE